MAPTTRHGTEKTVPTKPEQRPKGTPDLFSKCDHAETGKRNFQNIFTNIILNGVRMLKKMAKRKKTVTNTYSIPFNGTL